MCKIQMQFSWFWLKQNKVIIQKKGKIGHVLGSLENFLQGPILKQAAESIIQKLLGGTERVKLKIEVLT